MKEEGAVPFNWVIVGASFITLALVYSVWYSFAVFFVILLKEFGWSRSLGAGAFSLFSISGCVVAPLVGGLISSLGPQRVLLLGALFLGAGLALCSLMTNWWQFYLYFGIIAAIGLGASGWIAHVTIIQLWFKEKRGLATGIISSGIGIGILVSPPAVQHLILRFGWRLTYRLMAISIPLVIIFIAVAVLKKKPPIHPFRSSDTGLSPPNSRDPFLLDKRWAARSWTFQQAMATKPFWLLGFSFFLGNFMTQSIFAHQVAFFIDHGLEAVFASYLVGVVGVVSLGGKILWGTLSDRIGREITYTLGMIFFITGIALLICFSIFRSGNLPYFYSICFGMGYAVTAALPPLITADFFEGPAYGSIFGSIMVFIGVGGALGVWFAGLLYDWTLSYVPAFVIMGVCGLISCVSVWNAGPRKVRMVPGRVRK